MGNIKSSLKGDKNQGITVSRNIDRQIKADEKKMKKQVKLLLLGAGESGKSTVLKQMRLIHASGFKESEREGFRMIVFLNIFTTMQTLLEAVDILNLKLTNPILKYAHLFKQAPSLEENQPFPELYLLPLKHLWEDESVQTAYQNGHMFALHDNISYFYGQIDSLWNTAYKPTDQDIIRCRAKTTGIVETTFHLGGLAYRMFDVGGQRSERKKWIHCFDNVTAILFVVAISGYDQCLAEDRASNQMHEALMLFDTTCNSHWFTKTSMILLLNKIDIFKQKINHSPIENYFPDYQGKPAMTQQKDEIIEPILGHVNNLDTAKNYFKQRFQRLNRNPDKRIYVHFTDATDTTLLQNVMIAVSDIIINDNLNSIMIV